MNSKILFSGLLVFIFSASNFLFGQCPTGFVTFTSQSQIDNFIIDYPNCTEINGTLRIEEAVSGEITNLNGLSQIIRVENLRILNNAALTNLNGLNNLTAVTDGDTYGRLYIIGNQSLQNLSGLESLEEVSQDLRIIQNPILSSIEGLESLSSTTAHILIEENPSLTSLMGLTNLTSADGIHITDNDLLYNLNGLNNITELGDLRIIANQNLINLEGLNNLVTVGEEGIEIYSNPSLESFDGFESLVSSGDFYLSGNTAVTNLEGFSNLTTSLGSFGIVNAPLLTSLNGLENLTNVFLLYFEGNYLLNDISALSNIDINTPLYELVIHGSPELAICDYPNICEYLNDPANEAIIYDNAQGCNTREEILQDCGLLNNNENLAENNFSIYPNPTLNNFTISGIENGEVRITDSRGRVLKRITLGKDETSLNGLTEGVYFINITNEKGSVTKQVIKI
ncbi:MULTISPECIES: T9SS type A sorting domain-containing protein [Aequorivita]|uniref:T9SS type A sorting domain-containing protein n=1 Tax=Aequorivita iocasae TaxID=2803865 RepID=A0ABX7DNY4_9FLAO|nr:MULTISPECIES: T9SS type A sorting domain-containing protein [Aequorivita]QQX75457.1 T9SS type A sorting domain-containing protein [Aequorivita iocasae]UCA54907.1 T9SS type A sorting domain-containing protein [Aequorivita sp. F7]